MRRVGCLERWPHSSSGGERLRPVGYPQLRNRQNVADRGARRNNGVNLVDVGRVGIVLVMRQGIGLTWLEVPISSVSLSIAVRNTVVMTDPIVTGRAAMRVKMRTDSVPGRLLVAVAMAQSNSWLGQHQSRQQK